MFLGRQQDHIDGASVQPEESGPCAADDEENDQFWGLDDIPGSLYNGEFSKMNKNKSHHKWNY